MPSSWDRGLKVAACCHMLVGYLGLASTYRYGNSVLLVPLLAIAAMPLGEWADRRFTWYRHITSAVTLLFVLVMVATLRRAFLDNVVWLVMYIQVYSLIHEKKPRNYNHILLMSFFLILAACVLAPSAGIALVFVLFVMTTAWALIALEMSAVRPEVEPGAVSAPTASRGNRRRVSTATGALVGAVIGLTGLVLVLSGAIFFAIPRAEAGFLGASDDTRLLTTGVSSEVDLAEGGSLQSNAAPVMRVQFPEEPDGVYGGPLMWRRTTLGSYDGRKWVRRGLGSGRGTEAIFFYRGLPRDPRYRRYISPTRGGGFEGVDRRRFSETPRVYQEIFFDRPPEGGIPVLSLVQKIEGQEGYEKQRFTWERAGDFTAEPVSVVDQGMYIRAWSEVGVPTAEALRASSEEFTTVMNVGDYRHLTYHNLLPETQALAKRITEGAAASYDKVRAIETWLSAGDFVYTREIPDLPDDQPMDAFILQEKAGHCELFASALALMARSLGIPARVVSGYRGGLFDEGDRSYTITNDMAHLWVEVYFVDHGWVAFDPSPPATDPAALSLESLARGYSRFALKVRMIWLRDIVGFESGSGGRLFRETTVEVFRSLGDIVGAADPSEGERTVIERLRLPMAALLAFALSLTLVMTLRRVTRGVKEARLLLSPDQKRAVALHRAITSRLGKLGVACSGKTAEEIELLVSEAGLAEPGNAVDLLEAYSSARFGRRPLPPERFSALRKMARALRPVSS